MTDKIDAESKKNKVIECLFKHCQETEDFVFHNNNVKDICKRLDFGNPFDVTKLDNKSKLPNILKENDCAIVHIGNGNHKFVKGIDKVYHEFETINETIDWNYKKSLLNQYNSSESNILSVANNQRILHHFLFGKDTEFCDVDIIKRPKTYFPHRTKTSFEYSFGKNEQLKLTNIQIEIDLTIEFQGKIGIFEAKNGTPDNFSVYQIYHPFLYYYNAGQDSKLKGKIKEISCVYVVRESKPAFDTIKLWNYTFAKPYDITSIQFIRSAAYNLINQNSDTD
jgi:hypothetical protein